VCGWVSMRVFEGQGGRAHPLTHTHTPKHARPNHGTATVSSAAAPSLTTTIRWLTVSDT